MIELAPMTEAEFATYVAGAVRSYAQAHILAGDVVPEEALARAQTDYDELLPKGLASPKQHLFTLRHPLLGPVGILWFELREHPLGRSAFLYDVEIREDYRGRGLGRDAMQAMEAHLRGLGAVRISLNVFGYNHAARRLYESLGYEITGMGMKKALLPPAP